MSHRGLPIRSLLYLLLVIDLGLVLFVAAAGDDAPRRIDVVEGKPGAAMFVSREEGERPLLTRLDAKGNPGRSAAVAAEGKAAARLGGRLYLFGDRGASLIRERAPVTEEEQGEREEAESFEVEQFLPGGGGASVLRAAAGDTRVLLLVRAEDGALRFRTFDGIGFAESAAFSSAEESAGAGGAVLLAAGDGRFLAAVRHPSFVRVGTWRDGELVRRRDYDLASAARGWLAGRLSEGQPPVLQLFTDAEAASGARVLRVEVPLELPAEGARTLELAAFEVAEAPELVGLLPPWRGGATGGDTGPTLLLADQGELVVLDAAEQQRLKGVPAVMAAWRATRLSFAKPLVLHLILFVGIGMWARYRYAERMRRGELPKPALVAFRVAPIGRRLAAFVLDLALAFLIAAPLYLYTLAPAERLRIEEAGETPFATLEGTGADPYLFLLGVDFYPLFLIVLTAMLVALESTRGRSVGKALLGLRVVGLDGRPVNLGSSATRSILLVFDATLPPIALLEPVLMLVTRRRQRLGDVMAGTVVVVRDAIRIAPAATPVETGGGAAPPEDHAPK